MFVYTSNDLLVHSLRNLWLASGFIRDVATLGQTSTTKIALSRTGITFVLTCQCRDKSRGLDPVLDEEAHNFIGEVVTCERDRLPEHPAVKEPLLGTWQLCDRMS